MKKECFIIYGYQEIGDGWKKHGLNHPRWYVGLTEKRTWELRHRFHAQFLEYQKGNGYWKKWVLNKKSNGYSLDQVSRLHVLDIVFETRRYAEELECWYTHMFDAMRPNGFCSKAGNYRGKNSDETIRKMSKNRSGGTSWNKGIKCPRSEKVLKNNKRRKLRTMISKAKARIAKENRNPVRLSCTQLAERIVINANRPMSEREVAKIAKQECKKVNRTILRRACRIEPRTGKDMPNKEFARLEKIKIGKSTMFIAKPEFSSWMIETQEYFKSRRNRDYSNLKTQNNFQNCGRNRTDRIAWITDGYACTKKQAAKQLGIGYGAIQYLVKTKKLKEIQRASKVGCKNFICALSLKEEWRKRKTLTHWRRFCDV